MTGTLFLCATPIGNLQDVTMRVLSTLGEVDLIAAEDTRQTIKLLNHYEIKTPLVSYHEHNKVEKTPVLIKKLLEGANIALVTDAGTPAISDPGEDLVRACYEAFVPVTSLPGASAVITALTLSGLSTRRFTFEGFLPQNKKEQKAVLERFEKTTVTTIFYEAPHRLKKTLGIFEKIVGKDRQIAICKELTKKHETVLRFTIGEAISFFEENEPKGEFVLVVEGKEPKELLLEEQSKYENISIEEHLKMYIDKGLTKKDATKKVASDRGVPKREIYNQLIKKD